MNIIVKTAHSGVSPQEIKNEFTCLTPEIVRVSQALKEQSSTTVYASLSLPFDHVYIQKIKATVEEKKILKSSLLIVIGIGGSNLGTLALQEAFFGKLYNEKNPSIRIYYADTIDSVYISDIVLVAKNELEQGNKIIFNVVTKSGSTTETIANFEIFLKLLMQFHPEDYAQYVVVTTDRDSVLWNIADHENFALLEIPKNIGGRYSVFSAVGLFPLGLLGLDISSLLRGAADILVDCGSFSIDQNYAAQTACIIYEQYKKNISIQDMFLFAVQLEGVGKWYRQLMGESIGKEFNLQGQKVEIGITPTVSMGTVDLHSVGQLYLGGPRDKATTFVSVVQPKQSIAVPHCDQFESAVGNIQGRSLETIMQATLQGVQAAYIKNMRPFVAVELPECNEYYLGQFLQYKMVEMIYLGYLLGVNPFDQPNVESYKQETRKILSSV